MAPRPWGQPIVDDPAVGAARTDGGPAPPLAEPVPHANLSVAPRARGGRRRLRGDAAAGAPAASTGRVPPRRPPPGRPGRPAGRPRTARHGWRRAGSPRCWTADCTLPACRPPPLRLGGPTPGPSHRRPPWSAGSARRRSPDWGTTPADPLRAAAPRAVRRRDAAAWTRDHPPLLACPRGARDVCPPCTGRGPGDGSPRRRACRPDAKGAGGRPGGRWRGRRAGPVTGRP